MDRALDPDLARARDLDLDRVLALDDLDRACDLARARDLARALAQTLDRVHGGLVRLLHEGAAAGPAGSAAAPESARPSRVALRVCGWTRRSLSPAARVLYADELVDEVFDQADLGVGRRVQVACALRQLCRVRQLRVAARAARSATTMRTAQGAAADAEE